MHRLAAMPGGWDPNAEGVVFIEQTPGDIVILTAADTDIQTLAAACVQLPNPFPTVRVANLLNLQQQLTIDTYADEVLSKAKIIVLRILGGRSYWSYGLEVVKEIVEQTQAALIVLPGDDRPDPDLMSHSTVSLATVNRVWQYWTEGGIDNAANALRYLATTCLGLDYSPAPPATVPRVGIYSSPERANASSTSAAPFAIAPGAAILFYRAHYLSGNTEPIDALCSALRQRHLTPIPIFVSSLREPDVQAELLALWRSPDLPQIEILLNATSFSVARLDTESPQVDLWRSLNVPVLQVILSGGTEAQWQAQWRGLSPRDMAMNVALPEVDGRIITRAISFKTVQQRHEALETDVVTYQSVGDRVSFVADLAANWVRLRQTPTTERRVALILANYPTRDGRLANGVGLDTPASCIHILNALREAGYTVGDIPETGDDLIRQLTSGQTNDPHSHSRVVHQVLSESDYQGYFSQIPSQVQKGMGDRWGTPKPQSHQAGQFPIPGLQFGNVFVGIQPARGYDHDPSLNYHAPDLEPTHDYLAFYHWLRQAFNAHAIVHVGKHGNLEWLPGKSVALSPECYPEVALGAIPHLYPFIVNDPGEGSQAKRRAQAVIIDHLTPPLTRAELYSSLSQLEALIDEYYEAQSLDPSRLTVIRDRILQLATQDHLSQDLGYGSTPTDIDIAEFVSRADSYLCELKEAQIRDGLHIFGQCPDERQLRDLMMAIARHPGAGRVGLTRAIAQDWGVSFDPLADDLGQVLSEGDRAPSALAHCRTVGDAVEVLEDIAAQWIDQMLETQTVPTLSLPKTYRELQWMGDRLLPNLQKTTQEIDYLLKGLSGGYVPSGASGAPTRGRAEVLPTGRNFFSVDIRAIPTESAWDVGRKAAEALIERYTQEHGEYPKTLGLSIWGTSTMRTGGDDIAEALALLGVRPVWDGVARRVVDIEVLPVELLGRPRVDVTLRISGFFRDAFPNLIDLFDRAIAAVESLPESAEHNPLSAQIEKETLAWQAEGLSLEQAKERSRYRIFGSKPGAYGAGLQGLIESQHWETDDDLAQAYLNWSSYAYTGQGEGRSASEAFESRLRNLQIVLHNQDNREHDLLDSDDYYQFQGGLTAAVRSLTGKNPEVYFGDHSLPERPRIRRLQEEIARVYRSRVVNPKWIDGVMRHGYKGAFEMAATVDYLFAYSATTQTVPGYMYEGVAQAYLLDADVQAFIQTSNPWALRDMAERLLEAHQRGLWEQPQTETLEALRAIALEADAQIEGAGL
ncbi:MAG: cobaltochelatase subunit CobN [Synechococcales cyanobacterium T60_A2020_003]|nr:cobaltochelatase subunit CobN [Synechococcales cyanobacterium T60_A2020_003]